MREGSEEREWGEESERERGKGDMWGRVGKGGGLWKGGRERKETKKGRGGGSQVERGKERRSEK